MPDAGDMVLCTHDLAVGYGGRAVLKEATLQVRRGEIFGILGPSGSGKSTLMKSLIGLLPPLAGRVEILGEDLWATEGEARRALLRRLGVAYQTGALFGSLTVAENVRVPLEELTHLPDEAMDLIVAMKLQLVGLAGAGQAMPAELSGGMRKRAALARALALDPPLLFLDEPSAGLDPITSASLDRLILELRQRLDTTFVIVTHELDSIFTICDRVALLDPGDRRVAAIGDPRALKEDCPVDWVRRFFHRDPFEGEAA